MIIVLVVLGMMVADGCPISLPKPTLNGSCCDDTPVKSGFLYAPRKSGLYHITNVCRDCDLKAVGYCDATTDGGGWLVIQRRKDGSVNFDRLWADYETGFGSLTGEFWFGLRAIHCFTSRGTWQMRIDYVLKDGTRGYLSYRHFRVWSAVEKYKLSISGYDGTSPDDPFGTHLLNGMKFTTKDRDNDLWGYANCAENIAGGRAGGWWYRACSNILLNHRYNSDKFISINRRWYKIKFVEMKIRPSGC